MVSRQRAYQLRKLEAGLCQGCGKEPLLSHAFCHACLLKYRVRQQIKRNYKPWEKGKRGRPPMEAKK